MNDQRKEICLTVINEGEKYYVKTYLHEYRSLMMLLNNTIYLENFGTCGGQGRCATCMVNTTGLKGNAVVKERNEAITLNKAGLGDSGIRLSCQLLINEDLHESVIEIAGDGY